MNTYNVHMTMKSANAKTGPIPVSTTSYATCPTSCVFRKNGCYADSGPLALHWKAVTEGKRGTTWEAFCDTVAAMPEGTFWRHNQAGDLPSDGVGIDSYAMLQLVDANKGKRGFTYTHHNVMEGTQHAMRNQAAIANANRHGFTVNLSANDLAHADELMALNIGPVVVVVPSDTTDNTVTPEGHKVVLCPATQRDDVSCATCQLCQRQRTTIVAFPAHGTSKKKADVVARKVFAIVPLSR
jgi:hypothetical protein